MVLVLNITSTKYKVPPQAPLSVHRKIGITPQYEKVEGPIIDVLPGATNILFNPLTIRTGEISVDNR